jgi:hypothetical protein
MKKPRDRWRRVLPIAIVVGLCHVPDAHATALTFESVVNGSNLDVFIKIVDVTDLFTFNIDVTYDETLFDVKSVTEGPFLARNAPNGTFFFFDPDPIGESGTFSIANSRLGPTLIGASTAPGVPGVLALLTFGLVLGEDPGIALSNIVLLDSQGDEIPLTSVPEPAAIGLLGLGLLGIARRVRMQRQRDRQTR